MSKRIGHKIWAIPEGYIPSASTGPTPELTSHETVCILNTGHKDAHVEITVYFTDKNPVGPYKIKVGGQRTKHVRLNDMNTPAPIPRNTIMHG
jgi:hypothetical protein